MLNSQAPLLQFIVELYNLLYNRSVASPQHIKVMELAHYESLYDVVLKEPRWFSWVFWHCWFGDRKGIWCIKKPAPVVCKNSSLWDVVQSRLTLAAAMLVFVNKPFETSSVCIWINLVDEVNWIDWIDCEMHNTCTCMMLESEWLTGGIISYIPAASLLILKIMVKVLCM